MKGHDQFKLFSRQRRDIGYFQSVEYNQICIFGKLFWLSEKNDWKRQDWMQKALLGGHCSRPGHCFQLTGP